MAKKKNSDFDVNTQEIILNAAYILLSERGYSSVSTREIAATAGVALSQLNYYYKTKENLFLSVINEVIKKIVEELKEVFSTEKSRRENFAAMIDYFKGKIAHDPEIFKLLIDFMAQSMWNKEIKIYIYGMMREINFLVQTYIIKTSPNQKNYKGVPVIYVAEIVIYGVLGLSLHFILGKGDVSKLSTDYLTGILFDPSEELL